MKTQHWITTLACAAFACLLGAGPAFGQYALDIEVEPVDAGIVSSALDGDYTTVTAMPAEGYEFVGWEGDITATEDSMTFEMLDDTYLVAVFEPAGGVEYTLTAFVDPSGAGTIVRDPADFTYAEGTEVTLTAYADPGFVFTGWTGDLPAEADPTDATLVVTMDSDLDIEAAFAAAEGLVDDNTGATGACGAMGSVAAIMLVSSMLMTKFGRVIR